MKTNNFFLAKDKKEDNWNLYYLKVGTNILCNEDKPSEFKSALEYGVHVTCLKDNYFDVKFKKLNEIEKYSYEYPITSFDGDCGGRIYKNTDDSLVVIGESDVRDNSANGHGIITTLDSSIIFFVKEDNFFYVKSNIEIKKMYGANFRALCLCQ